MYNLAQLMGIMGAVALILSFLPKSKKNIISLQLLGSFLFAIQYLLFGIISGCLYVAFLLNLIGIFRCFIYTDRERFRADKSIWLIGFVISYLVIYALNFIVFGLEANLFNLVVEILPVIGTTALTYGYKTNSSRGIRYAGLVNSPMWLIYSIAHGSIGGIVCEVLCIGSVLLGLYRHSKNRAVKLSQQV